MAAGTILITQGTQTGIPIDTVGGTTFPISKIDIGGVGTTFPWQGQVTATGNTGTGVALSSNPVAVGGTDSGGTFRAIRTDSNGNIAANGTMDTKSALPLNAWGTTINTAGTAFGTLKAGINGSTIYITDLEINMGVVGGTVALYNGGTANVLAGSWAFNANGGIVTNRQTPFIATSGSPVTYQQQGTAALSITAGGFVK